MTKIHELKIKNFRGIRDFSHNFSTANFICLIGRGDSGKTTILDAISYVLSSSWNLTFFDSDFYNGEIDTPIEIEATLIELPNNLILENEYGLHIRGHDKSTNEIKDELEDDHEKALTIKLEINKDLEPKWYVINNRLESPKPISAYNRKKLNVFMISDYVDRHFSWSKGTPLYSLLKQQQDTLDSEDDNVIIEAIRKVKNEIASDSFKQFEEIMSNIISKAGEFGIDISNTSTTIDFKDTSVKDGRVCLHDDKIPFRLKGKGSKRLISIAIQTALAETGSIILIDEIEQGLEPDRVKHLVRTLERKFLGQMFLTTHSQSVIEEIDVKSILIVEYNDGNVQCVECVKEFQNVIRACPEATYAKKVIVCEGKTEIGICRALDLYRIKIGQTNLALKDIVYTFGGGDSFSERAIKLKKLNLDVCVFCDSDKDDKLSYSKKELINAGIKVVDCEKGNAIENQVFKDLPWDAIKELIDYKEKDLSAESVKDSVNSKCTEQLTANWQETDSDATREALGKTAKDKDNGWFKRIDKGEFLGSVIFKYFDRMKDKHIKKQLDELLKWIDGD